MRGRLPRRAACAAPAGLQNRSRDPPMLATQSVQSASPSDVLRRGPLLSIIIPTFNEHDNIRELVQRIDRCLAGVDWEIVFVDDDSADGTLKVLRDVSRADARIRHLQRIGRRGLASAVVEGILVDQRALHCRYGRRPAARREQARRDAAAARRARLRYCGRLAIHRDGRDGRLEQGAPAGQRCCHEADASRAAHQNLRPDERVLHAEAGCIRRCGPTSLQHGLQDPARHPGLGAAAADRGRRALCLSQPTAWRKQTRIRP